MKSDGGDGKQMKGSVNRNESGEGEAEASSRKPAEQQTIQPPPKPPKQDFIHMRAKRGQATDSHSLAERVIHFLNTFLVLTTHFDSVMWLWCLDNFFHLSICKDHSFCLL